MGEPGHCLSPICVGLPQTSAPRGRYLFGVAHAAAAKSPSLRSKMNSFFLILVVTGLSVAGYAFGRARSVFVASGDIRILHSLPSYYGLFVALGCGLPAILLLALWLIIQPQIIDHVVMSGLDPTVLPQSANSYSLMLTDIRNLASSNAVSQEVSPAILAATERYSALQTTGFWSMVASVICVALLGLTWTRSNQP